jgi:hypothetical protein
MPSVLHYVATVQAKAHFQTAGLLTLDAPASDTLQVRCLLFYEGKHTSMEGAATTYNAAKIRAIAGATNKWMAGGRRVKLYAGSQDHYISQSSTIGFLTGDVTAEEISADNLPLPGLTDLVGKVGIFGMVQISGAANVDQYRDGRLKELSVGITPNNEIVEVSAVSIPSLAGAALFSTGSPPSPEQAIGHFKAMLAYALTLSDQLQEDAIERAQMQLWDLFHAFMDTLFDIRETASENPDQLNGETPEALRTKAVEEYITQLRNRLQVSAPAPTPEPLTTIPLFGKNMNLEQMAAQIKTLEEGKTATEQQLAAQNRQLALFSRRESLGDRFTAARTKGTALVAAGKMTPADFDDKFATQAAPTIAQFSAAQVEEAETTLNSFEQNLTGLEYYLGQLDKFAPTVKFGMPIERDLAAPTADEADKKAEVFAAEYVPRKIY